VAVQLALALDRLGHNRNGMGIIRLSSYWKRSEGLRLNFINFVIKALLSLSNLTVSRVARSALKVHAKTKDSMVVSV
jgi:hypothetical protein